MEKGVQTRYIIYQILKIIKMGSLNFDDAYEKKAKKYYLSICDRKFIQNVVLNSMRNYIYIDLIIKKFSRKNRINNDTYFLLLGAITQLIILNFKEFAVVNSTVEIAKLKTTKISYNFINGVLRNIIRQKNNLNIDVKFNLLPAWFTKKTNNWSIKEKKRFINNINKEPDIHLVFRSKKDLEKLNIDGLKTTAISMALKKPINLKNVPGYKNGKWWVQDFATMLPLYLTQNIENKKTADLCAAPGGKTFQLLSSGANVTAFEKNYKRIKLMQQNLKRLKMKCKIINCDVVKKEFTEKFDLVVIDAPCSSVGTIRRNPEIFFKNKKFDLSIFIQLQKKLLEKAKSILNKKGEIIYMVCSFLNDEGIFQIKNFLNENKNFKMSKFSPQKFPDAEKFINKSGYFLTWPTILDNEVSFDGFFAAKLIKNV